MFLRSPIKFLRTEDLNAMRLALLSVVEKFIAVDPPKYTLYPEVQSDLQNLRHIIKSSDTDAEVLRTAHEICQRSVFKSPIRDLEVALTQFFHDMGIKNYFDRDSEDNFLRKCEYFNLIPKRNDKPQIGRPSLTRNG